MRRWEFIAGLSAAAWPSAARAQQGDRVPRVGVLLPWNENDSTFKAFVSEFVLGLEVLGWSEGRNLFMDFRWGGVDLELARLNARERIARQHDVILADTTPQTVVLQRETRTILIVFTDVSDPVGSGFVASIPRPSGNITGFAVQEPSMASKWVELLNEIAPDRKLIAAIFNPDMSPYVATYYVPQFEAAARSLKMESLVAPVRNEEEIETVMTSLGRGPPASVILIPDNFVYVHRAPVISLALHYRVPTIYFTRWTVKEGGLLSYGPAGTDEWRRAASYVDRILRGAKPADLPVQLPVKFEMAINVRTAKAIGITIPESLLLRADEVIE
jgi:putative ABC transport system substrate-binding protein